MVQGPVGHQRSSVRRQEFRRYGVHWSVSDSKDIVILCADVVWQWTPAPPLLVRRKRPVEWRWKVVYQYGVVVPSKIFSLKGSKTTSGKKESSRVFWQVPWSLPVSGGVGKVTLDLEGLRSVVQRESQSRFLRFFFSKVFSLVYRHPDTRSRPVVCWVLVRLKGTNPSRYQ